MSRGAYGRRTTGDWRPTQRQREVLDALVEGQSNAEIAVRLGITVDGAKWHVGELLAQTGCEDRHALASWWREAKGKRPTRPARTPLARPRLPAASWL
jgi:DNA-binding CsgD family transcriptional regulator